MAAEIVPLWPPQALRCDCPFCIAAKRCWHAHGARQPLADFLAQHGDRQIARFGEPTLTLAAIIFNGSRASPLARIQAKTILADVFTEIRKRLRNETSEMLRDCDWEPVFDALKDIVREMLSRDSHRLTPPPEGAAGSLTSYMLSNDPILPNKFVKFDGLNLGKLSGDTGRAEAEHGLVLSQGDMSEEARDDLFATVKLLLDEVVATPERLDRPVKAAALLRILEAALYHPSKPDDSYQADKDARFLEMSREEDEFFDVRGFFDDWTEPSS